ncbi:MAG: ABC transporter ATP-binding protein [Frankiaceae bacterium]|nr:ABC transporter ATP-binding protein [Frankiaceae bacterium]
MAGVVVRGLHKGFGPITALAGVDLEVQPGTVHGLLGPNGAGKTTLLRALLGLVRLDAGRIDVEGVVAGFVEVPGAYPYLTGRQNLEFLAALDDDPGDVSEALDLVGLMDRADTKVSGWSLGMRQRLGIAAALLRRPDVLVLDEPANGLDPQAARSLRQLIAGLTADGLTVLLCSHDLAEVDALCEDITVLLAGRVAWTGTVSELRARPGRSVLTTSDDVLARQLRPRAMAATDDADGGLVVLGDTAAVDAYVLTLAQHGVAVRSLRQESLPLEEAFLELTR